MFPQTILFLLRFHEQFSPHYILQTIFTTFAQTTFSLPRSHKQLSFYYISTNNLLFIKQRLSTTFSQIILFLLYFYKQSSLYHVLTNNLSLLRFYKQSLLIMFSQKLSRSDSHNLNAQI